MKISKNDNTITATETLKFKDFSLKEQEQFLDMIYKDGLTLEEAKEKMGEIIADTILVPFKEKNDFLYNCFSDMYMDKEMKTKVKADFTNTLNKYMDFYNFIEHLVKNGNLEESVVRRKIEEVEKEIENED